LAAASKTRLSQLPDLPSTTELGFPEVEISAWHGLLAPAGTPREVIELINKTIVAALKQPSTVDKLRDMGAEIVASTPEEMDAFLKKETVRWGKLIREAKIKGE
jgi:tripartite-type tricarboxylate transporter receptor subunit TctC